MADVTGVVESLESAGVYAVALKEDAGRSENGRRWSIIVTEIDKLEALVHYYFPSGHMRTMSPDG